MKETKEQRKGEWFTATPYPFCLNLHTQFFFNNRHPVVEELTKFKDHSSRAMLSGILKNETCTTCT